MKVKESHIALLRTMYGPKQEKADLLMVQNAIQRMEEKEQEQFSAFMIQAGEVFTDLMEDLDRELEKLADIFPDEEDPRNWDADDFLKFEAAIAGHEYEELWRTYALQKDNLHLVWAKVLERIDKL